MHLLCYQMGDTTNGVKYLPKQNENISSLKMGLSPLISRKNLTMIVFPREISRVLGVFMNHRISFEVKLLRSLQLVYECNMLLVAGSPKKIALHGCHVSWTMKYIIIHQESCLRSTALIEFFQAFFGGWLPMETKILQGSKAQMALGGHVLSVILPVFDLSLNIHAKMDRHPPSNKELEFKLKPHPNHTYQSTFPSFPKTMYTYTYRLDTLSMYHSEAWRRMVSITSDSIWPELKSHHGHHRSGRTSRPSNPCSPGIQRSPGEMAATRTPV